MKKNVSFFGLGYVGLATAVCLASKGFQVSGYDVDKAKMKSINNYHAPFNEPGLNEKLEVVIRNLVFKTTFDYRQAVLNSDVTFITVGTPSKPDGSIDLTQIISASELIADSLKKKNEWHLIVVKSTVTPGTTMNVVKPILEKISSKKCGVDFGLCMNPEFLREGCALEDTFNPDRIIIGEVDKESGKCLETLYNDFYAKKTPPTIRTTPENAELIKYTNNAFLAMKISFINMIADLCEKLPGTDINIIAKGIGLDKRIESKFINAGVGWGGSCLPKDTRALVVFSKKLGYELKILEEVININNLRTRHIIELAEEELGELEGKKISILGLSFKPETDDIRNAPSLKIIEILLDKGAGIAVYDPITMDNVKKIFGDKIVYCKSIDECLIESDCCILVTEWSEFKKLTPSHFLNVMRNPVVIDGRRIFDPVEFSQALKLRSIGLSSVQR